MPNRSIRGYLVGLAAIFLLEKLSQPKAGSDSPEKRTPKGEVEQPPWRRPLVVEIAHVGADAEEKQHREDEKVYWRKTGKYAFWAVVISGCALGAAAAAFWETRRQADAAEEGNRPWIDVAQIELEQFGTTGETIGGVFNVYVNDYGHSPGQKLFINGRIATRLEDADVKAFCKTLEYPTSKFVGIVAFPNRPNVYPAGIGNSYQEFESSYRKNHPSYWPKWEDFRKSAELVVYGCVLYTGTDGKPYHTGFTYAFGRVDITKDTVVPAAKSMKVMRDFYNPTYAD